MNIKIITDEKNPLFKRREITAKLGYDDKTPGRLEIRKGIAKKLGVKEELVIVRRINPDFGTPAADLEFSVYEDEKMMKEIEAEYMINRHSAEKKEKKPAPEAKEEPKKEGEAPAEKPAEGEKKGEATTEAKKASESAQKPQKPEEKKE